MRAALDAAWRSLGLTCAYEIVGDAVVAFASATSADSGSVLIAGTGAVAVRVENGQVADLAGGLGWLLGDEGAGFWLGRAAVRTAVATVQGRAAAHELTRLVVATLLDREWNHPGAGDVSRELIVAACERPPLALAALAPAIFASASHGETESHAVLDEAAAHLDTILDRVQLPGAPVVFAGSCLANALLHGRVAALLHSRRSAPVFAASDGALGAATLAARAARAV